MATEDGPRPDDAEGGTDRHTTRTRRTVGAFVVAVSTIIWWPAFTLGAWGRVFFEQILMVWAAATAALIVVLLRQSGPPVSRWVLASLLLPTVWIVAEFAPTGQHPLLAELVRWFGVVVTVLGLPAMVWVLLRTVRPDLIESVPARGWVAAAGALVTIAALSALLGWLHPYYLQCEDFTISGNSAPPRCAPGSG
ncbi:hypothetical protein [Demequina maris]|uniref:hypothetical protein n=1 Tax=Demequina maris TaxID=1638982 RepID=UPI0007834BBF|nr:hypothetical protein [Demequina maris]